jgi:hypothetical protein
MENILDYLQEIKAIDMSKLNVGELASIGLLLITLTDLHFKYTKTIN